MAADETKFSELEKPLHTFSYHGGVLYLYPQNTAVAGEFLYLNSGWMLRCQIPYKLFPTFCRPTAQLIPISYCSRDPHNCIHENHGNHRVRMLGLSWGLPNTEQNKKGESKTKNHP
jgi:hypothetical protein